MINIYQKHKKGKHRTAMQPQTLRYCLLLKDKIELMESLDISLDD
jgi:hypothetical protein